MKPPSLFIASLAVVVHTMAATPSDRIREGEVKQQQLQGDAGQLAGQLETMIGEYERNGLAGEDADTVRSLRDALQKLSSSEMKQVIDLLEKARAVTDAGEAKKTVSEAYASQKTILTQMQKLLAEHRRNQEALELSQQLSQLADRQAANLQNGIELGKWTGGRKPENFEAAMQANLEGQRSEQAAIGEELKILAEKMAKFAKDPENTQRAANFQQALAEMQRVQPNVENAAEALKAAQLFKAVADEKTGRDTMRRLAKQIAPVQGKAETLRQAERELAKIVADQKEIAAEAQKAATSEEFDSWLQAKLDAKQLDARLAKQSREELRANKDLQRKFNEERTTQKAALADLENNQGDLANRSDLVAQDLAKDAAAAAKALQAAREQMQEVRGALAGQEGKEAAKQAQAALNALQQAQAELAREAAAAAAAEGKAPADSGKALADLQKQVTDLAQKQADAAKQADKSGQGALAQQANQLAQQAAAQAPQAAQALQQGAAQAQQAAQAAQAGQPQQAAAAQQAAAQNLAQAAQQIGQQMAAMQQAQQQLAVAQKAADDLAKLIVAEQKLELETAKAQAQYAPKKEWLFKNQPATQAEIQQQTTDFKGTLGPDLAAAVAPISDAADQMGKAKTQLGIPDGAAARASEKEAIADLYLALKALDQQIEQAQAEMNQDPAAADANAMAQAAAQLAQAEQALAKANQEMQQAAEKGAPAEPGQKPTPAQQQAAGQMKQAAKQLADAAAKATEAAAQGNEMNEAAQAAAQQAAEALTEASAQANANQTAPAQAAAAQAAAALAQAQGALAQAQAGITPSAGPPMPGQPGKPGQPGPPSGKPGPPKPGNKPGQKPGMPGTTAAQKYTAGPDEAVQSGERSRATQHNSFAGLPPRERAAIEQAQGEKYPEEFGPQVEQYLRNLADQSSAKKP